MEEITNIERRLEGLTLFSKIEPMPQEVKDFLKMIENMEREEYR